MSRSSQKGHREENEGAFDLPGRSAVLRGSGREGAQDDRDSEVVRAYKYTAPAFLAYLQEQHDFQAPSWLTIGVMGCTTLSAQGDHTTDFYRKIRTHLDLLSPSQGEKMSKRLGGIIGLFLSFL